MCRIILNNWKAIAAMSENCVIGINNSIPWNIPSEIQWFRQKTSKQLLVMGNKTYESIKNKDNESIYVVLTTKKDSMQHEHNVIYINGINAINELRTDRQIWICGGAKVYEQTIQCCSELYLTVIKKHYVGDCYFPNYEDFFTLNEVIEDNEIFIIKHYINKKY
ncbi:MAG: dihydrofolate reductase [Lutisporaceae bacterium]